MNKEHQKLREEFEKQEQLYLEKFGENSLDRVNLWDPLYYFDEWQEVLPRATNKLKEAVEIGKAIESHMEGLIY